MQANKCNLVECFKPFIQRMHIDNDSDNGTYKSVFPELTHTRNFQFIRNAYECLELKIKRNSSQYVQNANETERPTKPSVRE